MSSGTIPIEKKGAWFVKDPTIVHPTLGAYAGGMSLQDVRDFCLQREDSGKTCADTCVTLEPWFIYDPPSSTTLCDRCRHINFSWLLQNRPADWHQPTLILRDMISSRFECNFCRLAINALCTEEGANIAVEDLVDGDNLYCCRICAAPPEPGLLLILVHRLIGPDRFHGRIAYIHEIENSEGGVLGRRISHPQVNYSLLKSWITKCEKNHDNPTETHLKLRKAKGYTLRAIDVRKHCVTIIGSDERYVALSYVWGGAKQLRLLLSNYNDLTTEGGLLRDEYQSRISNVVLHAMELVTRLGERFLWVDTLCIIQNGHDIEEQIQNMDSIYNMATWCLVSAAKNGNALLHWDGKDWTRLKTLQHVERIQEKELAVPLPSLPTIIRLSTWNKRAWTYQEYVLSQRRLIVSEYQMYFSCRHNYVFCEDRAWEHEGPLTPRAGLLTNNVRKNVLPLYRTLVREYTERNITYHEDALRAFSGVLSHFEMLFKGSFLFGLPDTELDQALLWHPRSNHHRRKSLNGDILFPSWSWVGWVGPVLLNTDRVLSRVKWKDPVTGDYFSSDEFRRPDASATDAGWYQSSWVEGDPQYDFRGLGAFGNWYYEKEKPDLLFLHPVGESSSRKKYTFGRGTHRLQFCALTCQFRITGEHINLNGHSPDGCKYTCGIGRHGHCRLNISNKSHVSVGAVGVPASLALTLEPGPYEFIRLSRGYHSGEKTGHVAFPPDFDECNEWDKSVPQSLQDNPDQVLRPIKLWPEDVAYYNFPSFDINKPWCIYHVMLIKTRNGISQRVGLGQIHVDAFLQEMPTWKDIILE